MTGLKSGAFTGTKNDGNPYIGDIGAGIDYDTYEANVAHLIDGELINNYRACARALIKQIQPKKGQCVLDVGCGTGISSMELFYQQPDIKVIALDISPGMLEIAKYKFHKIPEERLKISKVDEKVPKYWQAFRKETHEHKDNIQFISSDFEKNPLKEESMDFVIANQFMHWLGPSKTFEQIYRVLKNDGTAVLNTASHYYNDSTYPTSEYGFRDNDFLKIVLEEVSKHVEVKNLETLPKPEHNFESVESIATKQGFTIEHVDTYRQQVDLQIFTRFHVPVILKDLIIPKLKDAELKEITQNAIASAIKNPDTLNDTEHKYDIVPIFVLKKDNS